jgi:hypothetical protein
MFNYKVKQKGTKLNLKFKFLRKYVQNKFHVLGPSKKKMLNILTSVTLEKFLNFSRIQKFQLESK